MRKTLAAGVALVAMTALGPAHEAAADSVCDPYKNYSCLDAYLGQDFLTRLVNYYRLEWEKDSAPSDPKAPPSRRDGWPITPQTIPPYPYTEWPYGGVTTIGVTRPNSVDSPLMAALGNTDLGKAMSDAHVQVYGWVEVGGNISSNEVRPGGNAPAAYMFTPDTIQLDQAVVYIERLPDTVQTDHIDWGFRLSALYGENYRYTFGYGVDSASFLGHNLYNGYDFPMMYGEIFLPQFLEGVMIRVGRFISLPDIEAQLAPNNYMYSHSLTYAYDNYTNTGIQATFAITKNLFYQLGVTAGTEAFPWHVGQTIPNPFPNPLFPNPTMPKDPGAVPSITNCLRYQTDNGNDNLYLCADATNQGMWGFNNLQWFGGTYYHKFNEQWNISFESYMLYEKDVPNVNNPTTAAIIAAGGTPFSNPFSGIVYNAPNGAQCSNPNVLACTAQTMTMLTYINYRYNALNNFSLRLEYFNDMEGQRTGVKTRYVDVAWGLQHWFSPQVELRPEIAYYASLDAPAFNGNSDALPAPIPPSKNYAWIASADIIWHF
jgi:hypothetical protein